jgi:hypothetical protein
VEQIKMIICLTKAFNSPDGKKRNGANAASFGGPLVGTAKTKPPHSFSLTF